MTCALVVLAALAMGALLAGLFAEASFAAWMGDGWLILAQRASEGPVTEKDFHEVFGAGPDDRGAPSWWYYHRSMIRRMTS